MLVVILQGFVKKWPFFIWPKAGVEDIKWFLFIFFLMAVIILILKAYYKRGVNRDSLWIVLLNFLYKRNLSSAEIAIIKKFYNSMKVSDREAMLGSKNLFHEKVNEYLKASNNIVPEVEVNIMEKLFPVKGFESEILSLKNVYESEKCALQIDDRHYLATVIKIENLNLLLSIDSENLEYNGEEIVQIYFYRPGVGGYLVKGIVLQFTVDSITVQFNGEIEEKGERHLMSELKLSVHFTPWPLPEGEEGIKREIWGTTQFISDRSLVFLAKNEEDVPYYLKKHDIWLVNMTLPDGYNFTCRGRIMKSISIDKGYLYRFFDVSEQARTILFGNISKSNPVRDNLS